MAHDLLKGPLMRNARDMSRYSMVVLLALLGASVSPGHGYAQAPDGGTITLDCAADHQAFHRGQLYIACGARLLVFDLSGPRLVMDREEAAAIEGFHESDDSVWVELAGGTARRVSGGGGDGAPAEALPEPELEPVTEPDETADVPAPVVAPPPVPLAPTEAQRDSPAPSARIIAITEDEVTIDRGRAAGIELGDRFDLSPPRTGGDAHWDDASPTVVGVVDALDDDRARVRIGWREEVAVGEQATPTNAERTRSLMGPPSPPRGFRLSGRLIMGTPVNDLGIQLLAQGSAELRARRYLLARVVLRPTGVSIGQGRDFAAGGAYLQLGFDHRFVGAALGVGVESLAECPFCGDLSEESSWHPGITFPSTFRLGAVDGLMAEVTTLLTTEDGSLEFLAVDALAQMPLASGLWLRFRGSGGGRAPFWHGEAVVRLALRGNGLAGTTLLDIGVGATGNTDSVPRSRETGRRFGPSLVVGLTQQL